MSKKIFPRNVSGGLTLRPVSYFLLRMRIFVMLLDQKARQFSDFCDGMQFAAISAELSIRFGPALNVMPKKIECEHSEIEQIILPFLRGRVFHMTEEETFEEICRRGWITGQQQMQHAFAPRQSEQSYGYKRGWVSLYDLSDPTDAEIKESLIRYWLLKTLRSEGTHVVLIIAESAWPLLISWKRASQEGKGKELFIPFVEAWYPGDIPLQLITDSFALTHHRSPR